MENIAEEPLVFKSGWYYCLKTIESKEIEYPNINIFMTKEDALELKQKRKRIGEQMQLMKCYVSTQYGKLSVYNCKKEEE